MLEFLKERTIYQENFEGEIVGFNEETNKLVVNGVDKENNQSTIEISLFKSSIVQDINYYADYEKLLYNKLVSHGCVNIDILSTETGDSWFLTICRHKTLIDTKCSEDVIIVSYIIEFCGEVKGDILTFQEKREMGYGIKEEQLFTKWIREQIEKVQEFNSNEVWNTFSSIIASDALNTEEDYKLLHELFTLENNY